MRNQNDWGIGSIFSQRCSISFDEVGEVSLSGKQYCWIEELDFNLLEKKQLSVIVGNDLCCNNTSINLSIWVKPKYGREKDKWSKSHWCDSGTRSRVFNSCQIAIWKSAYTFAPFKKKIKCRDYPKGHEHPKPVCSVKPLPDIVTQLMKPLKLSNELWIISIYYF